MPRKASTLLAIAISCAFAGSAAHAQTPPEAPAPPAEAPAAPPPATPPPDEPAPPAQAPSDTPVQVPSPREVPPPSAYYGEPAPAAPADGEAVLLEEPAAEEAAAPPPSDEMVVTGSRIRRKDLTGPAPVIVFSREQILASGRPNIGEFLQTIPEQSNAIGRGTNNGGDGSIRVNLRGIGTQSTLVLLNGRRLAPGGIGADKSIDLSSIPTNVIERVEILKDGASAVYGSDAIAGVVNIITRKRFTGAEANVYGSGNTYGDGEQIDANATVGVNNEKGGVFVSAGYYNGAPIWAGNRDYSLYARKLNFPPNGAGSGTPARIGSGNIPGSLISLSPSQYGLQNGNGLYNALVRANPTTGAFTRDAMTGQFRPFRGTNLPEDGGDAWNYQPYTYLLTPQQRFNVFTSGDYQLTEYARVFFDAFYTKRTSKQKLAPEPLFLSDYGVNVSKDNLYNPYGRDFDSVDRRLLEFGQRGFQQDIHNFHLSAGLDGDLPDSAGPLKGFFWEAVFNYNRNEASELKTGSLRVPRVRDAVGPSFVDATGSPRCGVAGSPIDGCVPLNLFGGPGTITRDQVDPLTYTGVSRGYNEIIGALFNTSGKLFRLAAERPIGIAAGYEFRAMSGANIPDPITAAGETTGNRVLPTQGSYNVHEIYAELNIPIIEKVPLIDTLEVIAAGRGSFYSTFGNTFNYKLGGRWSPTADFALRGTYSTAFRAPSIEELYQGQQDNFANVTDPCASGVTPGSSLARSCGNAANNGETRLQLRSRTGGNPALQPEKAKIFTAGLVIRPQKLKSLSFTFDYFNTHITQTISGLGENVILQSCFPSSGAAPQYCDLIQRNTNGRIDNILNLNANTGEERLDGLDMTGQYDLDLPAGTFSFLAAVAYLRRYDRTLADGTVIKGAGTFDLNSRGTGGAEGAYPHFRFNAGINWALNGWSAGVRTFFIGSYKECGDPSGQLSGNGLCYVQDHVGERWVSAYNTWDLVVGYSFKNSIGLTSLSAGVVNLFNTAPPRVYNGFADTTDTYAYDMALRQIYGRLSHKF